MTLETVWNGVYNVTRSVVCDSIDKKFDIHIVLSLREVDTMGFWDSLRGHVAQFLDVIQWDEEQTTGDTLVYRPAIFDQVIQDGGRLVVREGQSAVFQKEGVISTFGPGTCKLSTNTPAMESFRVFNMD